ncbi:glycine-rich protein [Striga asiatica]|uniref:Glycine-rich protein n=1 Tax=Striga asiatica TaxID=4170 RepID=A0A5A7P2M1_STRAF|nr:glycine-rich protein [Striga asiatica]
MEWAREAPRSSTARRASCMISRIFVGKLPCRENTLLDAEASIGSSETATRTFDCMRLRKPNSLPSQHASRSSNCDDRERKAVTILGNPLSIFLESKRARLVSEYLDTKKLPTLFFAHETFFVGVFSGPVVDRDSS